jgi:hypothetical protein
MAPIDTFGLEKSGEVYPVPIKAADALLLSGINLEDIPNFCTHEHWGSIDSIGAAPDQGGFRADVMAGARPTRPTSVWDIILDPYLLSGMISGGSDPDAVAKASGHASQLEWWKSDPDAALKGFQSGFRTFQLTATFQCIRRGIQYLHDADIAGFDLNEWRKADELIQKRYQDIFTWYRTGMKQSGFSRLIRPVHPEFYVLKESAESKKDELSFTDTIMRIDPFLDLWKEDSPRRKALSGIASIEPADAGSWRIFIRNIFDLAAENHTTGIKQLQAYFRNLDYQPRSDSEIRFRGNLENNEIIAFQDWVMHECCRQANERKWIHQVHVGTNNIASSSPLPLEALSVRYPQMKIVMIHCWPFLREAGYLAKYRPNLFVDTCWLPVLNPLFLAEAFDTWINYIPFGKIMLGNDSTSIEMAAGSALFTREILTDKLLQQQKKLNLPSADLLAVAANLLHNNAVRLYGIGEEFVLA